MADFTQTAVVKTAVRELPAPITDAATFSGIIEGIIADNPWGCTPYVSAGVEHDAVEKASESYTVKVNFEDVEGNVVGDTSAEAPSLAAYNAAATAILNDTALATAIGGDPVRNPDADTFTCRLKCHAANGEMFYVSFTRKTVRLTSYEDDAILTTVETWADGVTALN